MTASVELQAFMGLADLFRRRGWTNPHRVPLEGEVSGTDFLAGLDIPAGAVEVMFVNHTAIRADDAVIRPGDRVALAPPGVPGPHRLLLGFKNKGKTKTPKP